MLGPGGCPPVLMKKCLAAVQTLSLTHFLKPVDFEKPVERIGFMEAVEMPVASNSKVAFQCLRCMVEGYWPEFDWLFIRQLEDAVGRLLDGPLATGALQVAARTLALLDAQALWEKGMRRVERAATGIRRGAMKPIPDPKTGLVQLFPDYDAEGDEVFDSVHGSREANTRATIAASVLMQHSASPSPASALGGGAPPGTSPQKLPLRYRNYTCKDHRDAWNQLFPGACQYFAITGTCGLGSCPLKHDQLQASAVDAHVLAVGGSVTRTVSIPSVKDG